MGRPVLGRACQEAHWTQPLGSVDSVPVLDTLACPFCVSSYLLQHSKASLVVAWLLVPSTTATLIEDVH